MSTRARKKSAGKPARKKAAKAARKPAAKKAAAKKAARKPAARKAARKPAARKPAPRRSKGARTPSGCFPDYRDVAQLAVDAAVKAGATDADALVAAGRRTSIKVREGEIEELTQAGSKGMGIRVLVGGRTALLYTSDFTPRAVRKLARDAVALARQSGEDPFAGIPRKLPKKVVDPRKLELFDPALLEEPLEARIERARACEAAAAAVSPRIENTQGTGYSDHMGTSALASSNGFVGQYEGTSVGLHTIPIAVLDGKRQTDHWSTGARFLADLDDPEEVGRIAAVRSLARLGGSIPGTGEMPVVFDATAASSLLGHFASACLGGAVFRDASFLKDHLGEKVAAYDFHLIDDPLMTRGLGSRPYDAEGYPSKRNVVIAGGVLERFLCDSYSARKLKKRSTHSASRGTSSGPGPSTTNLYLQAGMYSPEEILHSVDHGVFVTSFMGHGVNLVTGDYSRGATGFLIEKGMLTRPLQGFTIAGNLKTMLADVCMIGNDLRFRGSTTSPTLKVAKMTVGGT